jgi:hypothetical protein
MSRVRLQWQVRIVSEGGIGAIVAAMTQHRRSVAVQSRCARALALVASDGASLRPPPPTRLTFTGAMEPSTHTPTHTHSGPCSPVAVGPLEPDPRHPAQCVRAARCFPVQPPTPVS